MTKGEQTRQLVLTRATEIAGRLGLGGLTIGALADAAGMSKSGLFAHFRSKEELQLATLGYARDGFVDRVLRPALSAPRGEPRLRTFFTRWLAFCRDGLPAGCVYLSARPEFDDQPGRVRDQLVRDYQDLLDSIGQIVTAGQAEGHFRPDTDPAQVAQEVDGIVLAYFFALRMLRDDTVEDRAGRAFAAVLDRIREEPYRG